MAVNGVQFRTVSHRYSHTLFIIPGLSHSFSLRSGYDVYCASWWDWIHSVSYDWQTGGCDGDDDTAFTYFLLLLQCKTYEALILSTESTITVYGIIKLVPEGQMVRKECLLFPASLPLLFFCYHSPSYTFHPNYIYFIFLSSITWLGTWWPWVGGWLLGASGWVPSRRSR